MRVILAGARAKAQFCQDACGYQIVVLSFDNDSQNCGRTTTTPYNYRNPGYIEVLLR